jgi:hypothetical protein
MIKLLQMENNIKESLLERLKILSEEHFTILNYLENNSNRPENIEKDLKIKVGLLTMKCSYLEASMYVIISILANELGEDIEKLLTKSQHDFYYIYTKHVLPSLNVKGDTIETSKEIEEFLKSISEKK